MAVIRFPDAARHGVQLGKKAFLISLPLPTQERAWRDWVVGRCDTCVPVSRGRTLTRHVAAYSAHVCKSQRRHRLWALSCRRYFRTSLTFYLTWRLKAWWISCHPPLSAYVFLYVNFTYSSFCVRCTISTTHYMSFFTFWPGTTEIFTKGLSAFDANWAQTYGFFSYGLDDDGR